MHADEAGELTDLREVVEVAAQAVLVVVEPPRRPPLHERGDSRPRKGAGHRGEHGIVGRVDVVEDRARKSAVALEPAEEPGEPGCLALVADHVGSRVSTHLGQQPRRHVAQRPEVQLQHGLVGECEPGGEPDDLEHDDGALERRGGLAGPGAADHGGRERRVRGKVG